VTKAWEPLLQHIACFHCCTIIKTIQQIKSRIKEVKEDEYWNGLAKIQVCAKFRAGDVGRNVLLKFISVFGDAMFLSLWRAQIWRPEANKSICYQVDCKKPVVVSWGFKIVYMSTYSHTRTVQKAKSQRISHFFNLRYSILGRDNIVSLKSLEIQSRFITRRKTLSNRKSVKR